MKVSIFLLLLSSILPLVVLSFFNHPSADDFCFSATANQMGFWDAQIRWYNFWTGRYFSTALLSINPLVFYNISLYQTIPLFLIFFLLLGFYFLIRQLMPPTLSVGTVSTMSLSFFIVYAYHMPSLRAGLYWMSATLTYQLSNVLMLFLFGLIIYELNPSNKGARPIIILMGVFLTAAIVGSNETSMLLLLLVLFSVFLTILIVHRTVNLTLLIYLLTSVATGLIVILAPGNIVRMSREASNLGLFACLENSFFYSISSILVWLGEPLLFILTILSVPFFTKLAFSSRINISFNPLIPLVLWFLVLTASFFPAFWSLGDPPADRVLNVIYLFFLTGWFINLYISIFYCVNKLGFSFDLFSKSIRTVIQFFVGLFFFYSLFLYMDNSSIASRLYKDLVVGTAYRYDEEIQNRYTLIKDGCLDNCTVRGLQNWPAVLPSQYLSADPENWINRCYANYFGKKRVKITFDN